MTELIELNERLEVDSGPIHDADDGHGGEPQDGIALCLSGGGYRAMLFHTGTLWRLNELSILPKLDRVSSVSGGSITSGVLGSRWNKLDLRNGTADNFASELVAPIRNLASRTIDIPSVIKGALWFGTIGDRVADYYRKYLFGNITLQKMPNFPRFVINATNMQSGALWRFSKPYMADYRVGEIERPTIELATAVAASSAFPPVLSPVVLKLDPTSFKTIPGNDLTSDEYREKVILADGGIYDNLGLETSWKRYKTILVSDAGQGFSPEPKLWRNWGSQTLRTLFTIDNQVRSLRRRQVVESFLATGPGSRKGAFWSIEADASRYTVSSPFDLPFERTTELAMVSTRLAALEDATQERLINWGYAVTDLGIRQYYDPAATVPTELPYPNRPI